MDTLALADKIKTLNTEELRATILLLILSLEEVQKDIIDKLSEVEGFLEDPT